MRSFFPATRNARGGSATRRFGRGCFFLAGGWSAYVSRADRPSCSLVNWWHRDKAVSVVLRPERRYPKRGEGQGARVPHRWITVGVGPLTAILKSLPKKSKPSLVDVSTKAVQRRHGGVAPLGHNVVKGGLRETELECSAHGRAHLGARLRGRKRKWLAGSAWGACWCRLSSALWAQHFAHRLRERGCRTKWHDDRWGLRYAVRATAEGEDVPALTVPVSEFVNDGVPPRRNHPNPVQVAPR